MRGESGDPNNLQVSARPPHPDRSVTQRGLAAQGQGKPPDRPTAHFLTRTARPTVFRNLQIVCHEALCSHRTHPLILAFCASPACESKVLRKNVSRLPLKLLTHKLPHRKILGAVWASPPEMDYSAWRAGAISLLSWGGHVPSSFYRSGRPDL